MIYFAHYTDRDRVRISTSRTADEKRRAYVKLLRVENGDERRLEGLAVFFSKEHVNATWYRLDGTLKAYIDDALPDDLSSVREIAGLLGLWPNTVYRIAGHIGLETYALKLSDARKIADFYGGKARQKKKAAAMMRRTRIKNGPWIYA